MRATGFIDKRACGKERTIHYSLNRTQNSYAQLIVEPKVENLFARERFSDGRIAEIFSRAQMNV